MPDAGKVHVDILPDLKKFGPQLRARLEQSVQDSLSVDINPKVSRGTRKAGSDAGGEFARAFQTRLEKAMRSLPEGKVGINLRPAQQRLALFKQELRDLSQYEVGVDMDTATARMLIGELEAELRVLERDRDIDVRVDARAARAQLAAISADVDRLDGKTATVNVRSRDQRPFTDSSPAMQAAAWTAGPAAIPAIGATAGAGAGALSGLGAATAGLGAFAAAAVPAVLGLKEAIKAQEVAAEGGEKEQKALQKALAELTPSARDTVAAWGLLTTSYDTWQRSLQSDTLPVVTRGLDQVRTLLPSLSPIVASASSGFMDLLDSSEKAFGGEHWTRFTDFAARQAGPSIGILGRSVGNLTMGFTGLMVSFEPLWNRMGPGIEDLTAKFAAWANEGDNFTRFIAWTITNGPVFLETFASIAGAAVDVGVALGPLGTVYAQGLGLLAEAIGWIAREAPWLLQVAVAAKTASVAFGLLGRANVGLIQPLRELPAHVTNAQTRLQQFGGVSGVASSAVTRMRGALTGVVGVLGGPWGAALTGAMVLGGMWLAQKQKMAAYEESWEAALIASNGAIDENVRSTTAKNLADSGALEQAKKAGVNAQFVVDGLHKEGEARRALLTLYDALGNRMYVNAGRVDEEIAKNAELREAFTLLYGEGKKYSDLSYEQQQNLRHLSDTFGELQPQFAATQESQKLIAEATGTASGAQKDQNSALGTGATVTAEMKAKLDQLTAANLSTAQSELSYKQAKTAATESVRQNGQATDINTRAGQANRQALLTLVEAGNNYRKKLEEQGIATNGLSKKQREQREEFIKVARQMGYTGEAARKLADRYYKIPKRIQSDITVSANGRWNISNNGQNISSRSGGSHISTFSTGGPVFGEGTATSDSIPAYLSNGEFVQPTRTVDYYGPGFMEALRHRQIPKEHLPGFAKGGRAWTTTGTGPNAWSKIDDHREDVRRAYDAMANELINNIGTKMAKDFAEMSKGPRGVVRIAQAAVGKYPEQPPGSNVNAISRWYGMPGAAWCAMFISWLFNKAGASKALGGASKTAWTGTYYGSGMRRVPHSARQPGDVAVYGTDHVNLVETMSSRIGGNQTPGNVTRNGQSGGAIFRPNWGKALKLADGGLVDILKQDQTEDNTSPRLHPMVRNLRELAGIPTRADGGRAHGWTVVGERGAELVRFDDPARVYSAEESARVLATAGRVQAGATAGGDGSAAGPLVGSVTNNFHNANATVREAMGQFEHSLHLIDRGGRY